MVLPPDTTFLFHTPSSLGDIANFAYRFSGNHFCQLEQAACHAGPELKGENGRQRNLRRLSQFPGSPLGGKWPLDRIALGRYHAEFRIESTKHPPTAGNAF
jgi:hypothetical protein